MGYNMYPRHKVSLVFLFIAIGLTTLLVVNHFIVYAGQPYDVQVQKSYLALALDTHNIEAKINYIDKTIDRLDKYSGNSQWWYPTERSNIDETKSLLQTVSDDVRQQLDVKERENYFILPHNELMDYLNKEIKDAGSRLNSYQHGLYWNPANNLQIYLLFAGIGISIMMMIVFTILGENYEYQIRIDRKNKKE